MIARSGWERVTARGLWPCDGATAPGEPPDEDQVNHARRWITSHVRRAEQFSKPSFAGGVGHSYHLKHLAENWDGGGYVSNGALIEAALRELYRVRRVKPGSMNATFNMRWLVTPKQRTRLAREEDRARARETDRRMREARAKPGGVSGIYFLQTSADASGPIKIGQATDVRARVRGIQTSHPWPLRLLGVLRLDARADRDRTEGELHNRFSHLRMTGEWFRADSALLSFILGTTEVSP